MASDVKDLATQTSKATEEIGQNASASEEMSATSQELAAQSEQLQASIAYFRIENAAPSARRPAHASATDDVNHSQGPRRRLSHLTSPSVPQKPRATTTSKPQAVRNTRPGNGNDKHEPQNGFSLDLAHAADDHHDVDFVKY